LLPVLSELFANAFRHERGPGPITATARTDAATFIFTLSEPKPSFERATENWGREPLRALGQGRYGLGLYRARATIEAHRGQFSARHDKKAGLLVTTIKLPLAPPDA
jgi:hypothetical protein